MLTLASMVVSRLVFQHAGWGVAASVTPAVMGIAGTMFFAGSLLAGLPSLSPETAAAVAGIGATAGVVTQVRAAMLFGGVVVWSFMETSWFHAARDAGVCNFVCALWELTLEKFGASSLQLALVCLLCCLS
jgi:hypothetical protein